MGPKLRGGNKRWVGARPFICLKSVTGTGLADWTGSIRSDDAAIAEQRWFGCHAMRLIIWYDVGNGKRSGLKR